MESSRLRTYCLASPKVSPNSTKNGDTLEKMKPKNFSDKQEKFTQRYRCPLITAGILFVVGLILSSNCPPAPTPVISIDSGKIQGNIGYSRNGTEYWAFWGIPYAEPPLRELRFVPPIPKKKWRGIRQASRIPPMCKQFDAMILHTVQGDEDCLHINVFAPPIKNKDSTGDLLPVMVYFAGGAFLSGGSKFYHPDYLMDHQLIVVTFNYRLGPFGFLSLENETGDGTLPRGNMALKDQLLALQWVSRNAKYFGGDSSRVTLMGQSAGAASVHFHILSPKSQGLFHKAVLHSGSAFCPWAFSSKAKEISTRFVQKLGCPVDDREEMLKCLQEYDADEMVLHQRCMVDPRIEKDLLVPSIETWRSEDAFLVEHPMEIARSGKFAKVPLLISQNDGEGAFRVARFEAMPELVQEYNENWDTLVPGYFGFDNFPPNMSSNVRNHHFGNLSFTEDPSRFKTVVSHMASVAAMFEQMQRTAFTHAKSGAPVYNSFYNYHPKFIPGMYSMYRAVLPKDWIHPEIRVRLTLLVDWFGEFILQNGDAYPYGNAHGDDIFQLWNIDGEVKTLSHWERDFSKAYVQMVVDFVRDVKPMRYRGTEWNAIDAKDVERGGKMMYMKLDGEKEGKMIPEPFTEDVEYWRSIGIESFN